MEISVVETLDCDLTLYMLCMLSCCPSQHCETFISLNDILHTAIQPVHTDTSTSTWSVCPTYAVQLKLQPANMSLYEEVGQD